MAIKKQRVKDRKRKDKLNLGIRNREFGFEGWTVIFGYPHGREWKFYCQTVGRSYYSRPTGTANVLAALVTFHWKYLNKLRIEGAKHYNEDQRVVGHGPI